MNWICALQLPIDSVTPAGIKKPDLSCHSPAVEKHESSTKTNKLLNKREGTKREVM